MLIIKVVQYHYQSCRYITDFTNKPNIRGHYLILSFCAKKSVNLGFHHVHLAVLWRLLTEKWLCLIKHFGNLSIKYLFPVLYLFIRFPVSYMPFCQNMISSKLLLPISFHCIPIEEGGPRVWKWNAKVTRYQSLSA